MVDPKQGGISTSEGQGFGMLFAEAARDKEIFDRLWSWTQREMQRKDRLFVWRWSPNTPHVEDTNHATDGDLLIALALWRAAERWHEERYRKEALRIVGAVKAKAVMDGPQGLLILPAEAGFIHGERVTVNPSYWVFPALEAADRLDPDPLWQALIDRGVNILESQRYGWNGLVPDWLDVHAGKFALSAFKPPRFGYEAVRIPVYWLWWKGRPDHHALIGMLSFWEGPMAAAWVDLRTFERAPYPPFKGALAVKALIRACLVCRREPPPAILSRLEGTEDYYDASLILLSRLVWEERCRHFL